MLLKEITMKNVFWGLALLLAASCTVAPIDTVGTESEPSVSEPSGSDLPATGLYAEKDSWRVVTKSSVDNTNDIPWRDGEKAMLIRTDVLDSIINASIKQVSTVFPELEPGTIEFINEVSSIVCPQVSINEMKHMCVVSESDGLKCTLVPETPLDNGVYRAIYPAYDYVFYEVLNPYDTAQLSMYIHLSFLYEESLGLDSKHQDIVVSDPFTYNEEQGLSFVMKHICALVDIDIYPPKTGNYSLLKVISDKIVFPGKVNYFTSGRYDTQNTWFNFATLRADQRSIKQGEVFHTSTGLVPIEYNEMPMRVYLVYDDGTYYLSEKFNMPSLVFGVENKFTIDEFEEIKEPMQGLWGDDYMSDTTQLYDIFEWENSIN